MVIANTLENDMDAISNCIKYDYTNGLVEGKNIKIKCIEITMYGRCSFNLLRKKVLAVELRHYAN